MGPMWLKAMARDMSRWDAAFQPRYAAAVEQHRKQHAHLEEIRQLEIAWLQATCETRAFLDMLDTEQAREKLDREAMEGAAA